MTRLFLKLWRDESGLVLSTELVFVTAIVAIGMIVGLAAYRDGIVDELADNARAVQALNQSYAVTVSANAPAGITVAGNVVTLTKTYGTVQVISTFNNFSYTDTPDFGPNVTINRVNSTGNNEVTAAPPVVP